MTNLPTVLGGRLLGMANVLLPSHTAMASMGRRGHHELGILSLMGKTSPTQRPSCRGWQAGTNPWFLMRLAADELNSSLLPIHARHDTSHLSVSRAL